jgi:hypothetical protein
MKRALIVASWTVSLCFLAGGAGAGPVSPDCSVDKTAKHVAEKSTTGASTNRCSPSKAVKNSDHPTPRADQKTPVEKARDSNVH